MLEFEIVPKEMHECDSHGTVWMGTRATNQLVYDMKSSLEINDLGVPPFVETLKEPLTTQACSA